MDYDNQQRIFQYDGTQGITEELSPEGHPVEVEEEIRRVNSTFLVRMKDDSFLLVSASSKAEVLEQVSKITNPKQTIIAPFDSNFVLEFEQKIPPLQHIRDGPLVYDENVPKFNFLDMCLKSKYSNLQVSCNNPEKKRVNYLPAHYSVLSRWDFFKRSIAAATSAKKKKKGKNQKNQQNIHQGMLTLRELRQHSTKHVEIILRYAYAPKVTPDKWIPEDEKFVDFMKDTEGYIQLLNLAKKVGMLNLYQRLCYYFLQIRLKNCSLTLPVYTSDETNAAYEEEKEHFEEDFFKKRFVKNMERILKVWEEVKDKGVLLIENYIAVYLLEHCIGTKEHMGLLPKEILEYKVVKYYIQKNDVLLNLGRRNLEYAGKYDSPLLKEVDKRKKKKQQKKMTLMGLDVDDNYDQDLVEFPFKLSVCGDYNFESFTKFKKSLFPEVHKVEKEIVKQYEILNSQMEKVSQEGNPSIVTAIQNVTTERKKEKEFGMRLRRAWVKEKETSMDLIRKNNDEEEYVHEEDLMENEELLSLQLRANRFLLPPKDYMDAEDDSEEEEEDLRKCVAKGCDNHGTKICTRCRQVFYCSRECQVKDWKFHKKICGK